MKHFPAIILCLLCGLTAACSSADNDALQPDIPTVGLRAGIELPAPADLDGLAGLRRSASGISAQLLNTVPSATSHEDVSLVDQSLMLDTQNRDMAWAIFSISGFNPDGSIHPLSLDTEFSMPLYLALPDYGSGRWEWHALGNGTRLDIDNGEQLISPAGNVHVAVLSWKTGSTVTDLTLNFNANIPQSPFVQINVPEVILAGHQFLFDITGSTPGDGAEYTESLTQFGDGKPDGQGLLPGIPSAHIYDEPGSYTLSVTLTNDRGLATVASLELEVTEGRRDLLLVHNGFFQDGENIAWYYASPYTGRGISPDNILELGLGDQNEQISRSFYETEIRDPIRSFITDNGLTDELKYIVLMDGMPHQILGTNGGDYNLSSFSSVDSELCTLFSDGSYSHESFLWNEEQWQDFGLSAPDSASFFIGLRDLDSDYSFSHGQYKVTDNGDNQYDLDYLVARLDAYSPDTVLDMIDRSLAADTSGSGWVVFDTTPARFGLDTMTDPVWPLTTDTGQSGEEELSAAGYNHFIDKTELRVTGQASDGLPEGCVDNVIAYAGWGVNHSGGSWPSGSSYILDDLLFNWLPGAAWISYESFNGTDFTSTKVDGDRSDINRKGQGQICDFLHRGGTVAIGHVYEPWTIAVGDERAVYYRYCVKGDNWIESAYKGLRCLSWMDVVVGDPLCRVVSEQ